MQKKDWFLYVFSALEKVEPNDGLRLFLIRILSKIYQTGIRDDTINLDTRSATDIGADIIRMGLMIKRTNPKGEEIERYGRMISELGEATVRLNYKLRLQILKVMKQFKITSQPFFKLVSH